MIFTILVSCFTFFVKILIDNNCHLYLDSQNRINLAVIRSFICGGCTGDCICYLIAQKCQLNFVKKQELLLATEIRYSAAMCKPSINKIQWLTLFLLFVCLFLCFWQVHFLFSYSDYCIAICSFDFSLKIIEKYVFYKKIKFPTTHGK